MDQKVLIFGAKGTLGQALCKEFLANNYSVVALDREELDVCDFSKAEEKIVSERPDILINATAYNGVDAAEADLKEQEKAMLLNSEVPGVLAGISRRLGSVFMHYSTDYVFSGDKVDGYKETDNPNPLNFYGKSKLEGEKKVISAGSRYFIIRLSRLFGQTGTSSLSKKSFVEQMLAKINEKEVRVVDEEISSPAYAPDLAKFTRHLVEDGSEPGVYHGANSGSCTWYGFAKEIFEITKHSPSLVAVSSSAFPRAALIPKFSILLNTKRPAQRTWQEALKDYLQSYV